MTFRNGLTAAYFKFLAVKICRAFEKKKLLKELLKLVSE
jgi:hypothetical protein